jgi:hypothetical protein
MGQAFGTHNLEQLTSDFWHPADIGSSTKYSRNIRLTHA